jgi:hypothetical protein
MPKLGPFKALAFKIPTTQTEDMYIKSIDKTVDDYAALLREQSGGRLTLTDMDFDTGRDTRAGEYSLADKTYARLLDDLAKRNFDQTSPELRQNILAFYAGMNPPVLTKKDAKAWRVTQDELDKLKGSNTDHPADTASRTDPVDKSWSARFHCP